MSNFFLYHNDFNSRPAADASKCVYMLEKVATSSACNVCIYPYAMRFSCSAMVMRNALKLLSSWYVYSSCHNWCTPSENVLPDIYYTRTSRLAQSHTGLLLSLSDVSVRQWYRGRASASCTKGSGFESRDERVLTLGFFNKNGAITD